MATQTRGEAKLSRSRSVAALRVREHTEEREKANLAEYATRSASAHRDRLEELGLTYVSPSTYRVPVARLAAAQAALSATDRDR